MKSLQKNFLYNVLYQILLVILPLITAPYISRTLGATAVGVYSYTYSVAYYFLLIAMLGIGNHGNRSIAAVRDDRKKLNKTFSSIYSLQVITFSIAILAYAIYLVLFVKDTFKSVIHPGDITIADYWGIEKAAPEFDDNKGVSLVLVNNEAGEKIFEKVKKRLIWKQTKLEDSMQPPLKAPFPKPDNREQFWSDFENKSFEYVAKKYGGIGLKNDAKLLLRKIKRKIKKLVVKGGKRDSNII